jgi:hypothetical protein
MRVFEKDKHYLSAVITFLNRENNEKTMITYPITAVTLLSPVTKENPTGLPHRSFFVENDKWVEILVP